jgi:hypothetical protein
MEISKKKEITAATQAPTPKKNRIKPGTANSRRNSNNPSANQIVGGFKN